MFRNFKWNKGALWTLAIPLLFASPTPTYAQVASPSTEELSQQANTIKGIQQINPTTVEVIYQDNTRMTFDFYGDHIFRLFQDNQGGILRDPQANPPAQILVDQARQKVNQLICEENADEVSITTTKLKLIINKKTSLIQAIKLD
ncbi:MAG: TIM-barrel domain-containing protein, partial [Bacteroides sp.]